MSKGVLYEPTITMGTAYNAIVIPTILRQSVALEPKVSVAGTQTVTPPVS